MYVHHYVFFYFQFIIFMLNNLTHVIVILTTTEQFLHLYSISFWIIFLFYLINTSPFFTKVHANNPCMFLTLIHQFLFYFQFIARYQFSCVQNIFQVSIQTLIIVSSCNTGSDFQVCAQKSIFFLHHFIANLSFYYFMMNWSLVWLSLTLSGLTDIRIFWRFIASFTHWFHNCRNKQWIINFRDYLKHAHLNIVMQTNLTSLDN